MYPGPADPDLGVFVRSLEEQLVARGHDQRRTSGERCDQSSRNEEVGVHDVRVETARGLAGRASELEVLALPASTTVENGAFHVVTTRDELLFEPAHEYAEIGIRRTRIHLRDEQDPQARRCASRGIACDAS